MRKLADLYANHPAIIVGAEMLNSETMKEVSHLLAHYCKDYHTSMQRVHKVLGID